MIYEKTPPEKPIEQGDIFYPLPFVTLDLDQIPTLNNEGQIEVVSWEEVSDDLQPATLPIEKIWGIVGSQDCDAARAPSVTFFVIKKYTEFNSTPPTSPAKWVSTITQKKRENLKIFYLPIDTNMGFAEKMFVSFEIITQVPLAFLESRKEDLRKGQLNKIAKEHFRESIAQFFRRYPYDEWYPLDKPEFEEYKKTNGPNIEAFPWQT